MKRPAALAVALLAWSGGALGEPQASPPAATAVPKSAAPPKAAVAGQFGDWVLVCDETSDKTKAASCRLVQRLIETNSKKTVFHLIVGYGPRGNLLLIVRAPLGVALAKGIELSLGEPTSHHLPFGVCRTNGCQGLLVIPTQLQEQMRKASQATLTVYAPNGKALRAAASLKGFAEALAALDKRRKPS